MAALALCLGIVFSALLAGGYFLLSGKNTENSTLVLRVEAALEEYVGDEFEVDLPAIDLGFSINGKANLKAENVTVRRRSDGAVLAELLSVQVQTKLTNMLSGNADIDYVSINGANLNADLLGSDNGFLLPPHFDKPLNAMGKTLQRVQKNISVQGFKRFQIKNLAIDGNVFGRLEDDSVLVESLLVEPIDEQKFQLTAEIATENSEVNLSSTYALISDGTGEYIFNTSGISLREWLHDPAGSNGVIGSDGTVDLSGRIAFRPDGTAYDPIMNVKSTNSLLRIGPKAVTHASKIDLNFHFIIARNQIELIPSELEIGRLKATLIGGVKPANDEIGYAGPLLYDIIMQRGEFVATTEGEPVLPAGFKVAGLYDRKIDKLEMNRIVLTTRYGAVEGSGSFGFTGETPSLVAKGTTSGISVAALKQFWPFFIADKAREWVHENVLEGKVISGTLRADIPPGIIFRLDEGAKLKPEHFKTELNLEDFAFKSFGEMPPIINGEGQLVLEGMQISASMTDGEVTQGVKTPITVQSGKFVMDDFEAEDKKGDVSLVLVGDAQSIAMISDRKPLKVMDRLKVSASQFSGTAHADIAAVFPIDGDINYEDVKWNVLLDLRDASSSKPISKRRFTAANLLIDANPEVANVTGTTQIDGVPAKVLFVEPIGKSGKAKRSRSVTARLSNEDREKLGFDLNPVVDGPITIKIEQSSGKERFEVDFQEAILSLPWIGWSKGKKISAKASFDLNQKGGQYDLTNFKLDGLGFTASGNLLLDKSGLIVADMKSLALNEGDDLQLRAERKGNSYQIKASGVSFDARGVLNTLIYESSFSKAQGSKTVDLEADFSQVTGFQNRTLLDARLRYKSDSGKMTFVDLTAQDALGKGYEVQARRNNNQTNFIIRSNNSGNALAFTNIYTRMEGGVLTANLLQNDNGPYLGPVRIQNFDVVNEPRLASFASSVRRQTSDDRGQHSVVIPEDVDKRARFTLAESSIEKGKGYLKIQDAIIRNSAIGLTASGLLYNEKDAINLNGTFMPSTLVNSVVSKIPLLGALLSGRDNPFIGITYRLSGPRENPQLVVNPLSLVAPGVFKKVFEFRD